MGIARASGRDSGFILVFTLLMILGISAVGVAMLFDGKQNRMAAQNYMHKVQSFYASDGMMTLLADEVLNGRDSVYTRAATRGFVNGMLWKTSGHFGASDFRVLARSGSLGTPKTVKSSSLGSYFHDNGFMGDPGYKDDYGFMYRGYLHPPATGSYTFYVRADDESEFFLSVDDKPANLPVLPLAYNYSHMEGNVWPSKDNQPVGPDYKTVSAPVFLKSGQRYYFEFFHKENGGSDFGQVGWSGPEWVSEKPIPGIRLSPFDSTYQEAREDTAIIAGTSVRYSVKSLGTDVFSLFTEGFKAMAGSDTLFRSPLQQRISMKGSVTAPPDTMWSKVIFYDYHSDKSNPEFESPPWGVGGASPHLNMVKSGTMRYTATDAGFFGLDSIGKPVRTAVPDSAFYSCGVDRWFDPWVANSPVNHIVPRNTPDVENDCVPVATANDTLFKNVRIYDSLPFIHRTDMGSNAYAFTRTGGASDSGFFWIDGKGFGKEGKDRNYSFCMEMHSTFELLPGMEFDFKGDDDVWLFIDHKLVMDLGGIHVSLSRVTYFDDLGLTYYQTYPFDFFYCERMTVQSVIKIQTNVPVGRIKGRLSKNWKRDFGALD
ncbi:MAG: psiC [Fibrobacteres bacterium]|nr:psiC [Fibrobacterota bacterium]